MSENKGVARGQRLELVFGRNEGRPVASAMRAAAPSAKPAGALRPVPTAVPPSASRNRPQARLDPAYAMFDLGGVARKLLAERRGGVASCV